MKEIKILINVNDFFITADVPPNPITLTSNIEKFTNYHLSLYSGQLWTTHARRQNGEIYFIFKNLPRGIKIFDQSEFCISTVVFKFWGWAGAGKKKQGQARCVCVFVLCSRSWCVLVCALCAAFLARLCFDSAFCSCLFYSYFFSFRCFPSLFVVFTFLFIVFDLFLLLLLWYFVAAVRAVAGAGAAFCW